MKWNLIESGFNTGQYNMDFDVDLATKCRDDEAFFRLYRWQPYSISLGANQSFDDINLEKAKSDNIDVVVRPTGGRAILHAEEITYSVVIPYNKELTAKTVYEKISNALALGSSIYDKRLNDTELENLQPDFPGLLKQPSGMLCFASTAKNEVKFKGKKIIGSAQRKMNKVLLQHGSILCGTFHQKLTDYLNYDQSKIHDLKTELADKTIEIETITNEKVNYSKLSKCLIEGFENGWNIKF